MVWFAIYAVMISAAWLYYSAVGLNLEGGWISFSAQIILQCLWYFTFFKHQQIKLAIAISMGIFLSVLWNIAEFGKVN